jgi:hypothetical protein
MGVIYKKQRLLRVFLIPLLADYGGYCFMNIDLILMLGTLILLAISGLLVFCFTESKGKNTPHARRYANEQKVAPQSVQNKTRSNNSDMELEKTAA